MTTDVDVQNHTLNTIEYTRQGRQGSNKYQPFLDFIKQSIPQMMPSVSEQQRLIPAFGLPKWTVGKENKPLSIESFKSGLSQALVTASKDGDWLPKLHVFSIRSTTNGRVAILIRQITAEQHEARLASRIKARAVQKAKREAEAASAS